MYDLGHVSWVGSALSCAAPQNSRIGSTVDNLDRDLSEVCYWVAYLRKEAPSGGTLGAQKCNAHTVECLFFVLSKVSFSRVIE